MKRIFIAFGHHNTKSSFNAGIKNTFIAEATICGHEIDLVNLFEEKEQLPFYNQNINPPPKLVLEYRKRLEKCNVMMYRQIQAIQDDLSAALKSAFSRHHKLISF